MKEKITTLKALLAVREAERRYLQLRLEDKFSLEEGEQHKNILVCAGTGCTAGDSAILINVARGPVVNNADLYEALVNGRIAGAGLDVLEKEPISKDNPLGKIKDSGRLIITPHLAWASVEARKRCIDEVFLNLQAFIRGEERNAVC